MPGNARVFAVTAAAGRGAAVGGAAVPGAVPERAAPAAAAAGPGAAVRGGAFPEPVPTRAPPMSPAASTAAAPSTSRHRPRGVSIFVMTRLLVRLGRSVGHRSGAAADVQEPDLALVDR